MGRISNILWPGTDLRYCTIRQTNTGATRKWPIVIPFNTAVISYVGHILMSIVHRPPSAVYLPSYKVYRRCISNVYISLYSSNFTCKKVWSFEPLVEHRQTTSVLAQNTTLTAKLSSALLRCSILTLSSGSRSRSD